MEEYTARPGDTFTLSAYVCPADAGDGTISWRVSDTSSASVTNGVVKVNDDAKEGVSFNVIAKAGNRLAVCTVKVWKEKSVYVLDSYAEDPGTGMYLPGTTVNLSAGVSENKIFDRWESDDIDVWYSDAAEGSFEMPARDVMIKAVWKDATEEKEACTVSFNMCGHGTTPETQTIAIGQPAEKPADPVAEGYDFLGWYTEEACTNAYDFDTAVTEDITLYAKWDDAVSAMNPIPVIKADTKELYLVKGQAFPLPDGKWTSDMNKYVKITKKGTYLSAKKVTADGKPATIKLEGTDISIKVYVTQPKYAKKKVTLTAGAKDQSLSFTYDKHNAIQWATSAPDVATVSRNGLVNAVAKGKATITAFVNGKAYSCTVTVKEDTPVAERTLHLNINKSKKISIKGVKANKATWSVSANTTSSVEVDKGKVKAGSTAGTATVICKTADGKTYYVFVTVEDPAVKTGKIETAKGKNKYKVSFDKAGEKTKIVFNNVAQPVVFRSSAGAKAYVNRDGYIVANGKGKATLKAKINGTTVSISVKVNN